MKAVLFVFISLTFPNCNHNWSEAPETGQFGNCMVKKFQNLGKKCVDIGCGIGGVMWDLADTKAELTGVTIAGNEAAIGNERFENEGLENCRIMQGNCCCLPLLDGLYDSAYAVIINL